ncbi:Nuclear transport factor 2 family protein [Frankia sp. AiPs1]|uniref:nuclear transport factor 2 family protein n=1 Tax=Frankia sp. AiPa1 TaxID=573492 RepID=UPI00202B8BAB|nr:nuclear transport factor 2 family protein [Frankia sp. AiPa1]MCL9760084.1 nuclear transport factor 2 family protein [Frankia sp. AiPa1]
MSTTDATSAADGTPAAGGTPTADATPTGSGVPGARPSATEDLVAINQLLARYAVTITQGDIPGLIEVFTPDGTYSAFGDTYTLADFPELVAAAPSGLFLTGTALVDLSGGQSSGAQSSDVEPARGDTATGTQPLCFIDHATHDLRIGYYNDTYLRTAQGWRLRTRAMTFIRRNGTHDSGRPHDPRRPRATSPVGGGR